MPEILPTADDAANPISPPAPRSALFWDGTHWHVPRVDDDGRVQVRGEDQLFSITGVIALAASFTLTALQMWVESLPVPAGAYWIITSIVAWDATTPTTAIDMVNFHNGVDVYVDSAFGAFVAGHRQPWSGHTYLDAGDTIHIYFTGAAINDICHVHITGYQMTVET